MDGSERHARAKSLFLELMELSEPLRAAQLKRAAGADAELFEEVASLLRHAGAEGADAQTLSLDPNGPPRPRFASGDVFAERYRIVAELGRGASGEVYRAVDTRLEVEVALKIIHRSSPEAIRRLQEETRIARQITDPAVCRIYDIGESDGDYFLTMELIDGEDLAALLARVGRLSTPKVRQLGIELLDGLAAAHARGILHRDLKPSNVMIDGTGSVRLTDFGIAAYDTRAATASFAGTPAFMAPEQLEHGAPASVQTDLYAAGLILYEALVGHVPDEKRGDPRSPSHFVGKVDAALESVVMRLLAANPQERPQSATEAANALAAAVDQGPPTSRLRPWKHRRLALLAATAVLLLGFLSARRWLREPPVVDQIAGAAGTAAHEGGARVAILPLADESEGRDQSSLAQEIQRRIIDRLELIPALRVIAEDSSDRFAGADASHAGRELGVDFVALGRIEGRADDPRVELALYRVDDDELLWRETYTRNGRSTAPLDADRQFVGRVSDTLAIDPGNAVRPSDASSDASTHALFLRGREHVPPYSELEFRSSVALLNQVIERDSRHAEAHAAIATAYVTACAVGWIAPGEGYPLARRYAERALVLDATICEAHVAAAIVAGEYDWDWTAADESYRNAIELCPGSAWAHRSRARFLATQGRFDEAVQATLAALELDPTSALMVQGAAQRFHEAGQYARSAALAQIAERLDPLYPYTYSTLGFALIEKGEYDRALDAFDKLGAMTGRGAAGQVRKAYAFMRAGDLRSAATAAAEAQRAGTLDPAERALLALAELDESAAVSALAVAVEGRAPPSIWLGVDPVYEPLRDREDFRRLVTTVGLPVADD